MKKIREILRNIIIFVTTGGISLLPTLIFVPESQRRALFGNPVYWVITGFIAMSVTWKFVQDINESQK